MLVLVELGLVVMLEMVGLGCQVVGLGLELELVVGDQGFCLGFLVLERGLEVLDLLLCFGAEHSIFCINLCKLFQQIFNELIGCLLQSLTQMLLYRLLSLRLHQNLVYYFVLLIHVR